MDSIAQPFGVKKIYRIERPEDSKLEQMGDWVSAIVVAVSEKVAQYTHPGSSDNYSYRWNGQAWEQMTMSDDEPSWGRPYGKWVDPELVVATEIGTTGKFIDDSLVLMADRWCEC